MNYYCINLKSAIQRRLHILNQAERAAIDITFIDAIEGKDIEIENVDGYDRKKRLRYMKDLEPNEIACTLSHRLALETFLADPYPHCVIMEDDAIFDQNLHADTSAIVSLIKGFDLFKLESRDSRGVVLGTLDRLQIILPLKASNGATAILYTKNGARKLLESLDCFSHAIDTHIGFAWKTGILCVACWPPLIREDAKKPSTIGGRSTSKRLPGTYPWLLARRERVTHSLMKRLYFFFIARKRVRIL
jgi:glycosyl transferase family 25